ncbi:MULTISPECIES: N-acetylmuramoyl-L-alanine amidase CwlD [Allobacillus]|uniref:N-acetylmuramoyl-L-alanine amidase CwlD n=1 Tax=Allobacillus salarius TaxID=1955272 RepID=A0A556PLJ0_9BACI|nr:N-acetylmuramoyl-L-alanine amidase CwlD [Allobacillus salarius]TSJ65239.1 N-acetylmuramoyl-L-alanine amidase CwlD [Allobacillus salarius]
MKKLWFILLWLVGLVLLIYLIRYPIPSFFSPTNVTMPLANKVIVIDPGHGGPDGGADHDSVYEESIALDTSLLLRDYLQQAGALVYMTRESDIDLAAEGTRGLSKRKSEDIRNRVKFIQEKDPDLFISVHLNSIASSQWSGAQSFYYPDEEGQSEALAKSIQKRLREETKGTRVALGLNQIYLLKHAGATGTLVELGFLSNPDERRLLTQESYQKRLATSIAEGIVEFIMEEDEDNGAS